MTKMASWRWCCLLLVLLFSTGHSQINTTDIGNSTQESLLPTTFEPTTFEPTTFEPTTFEPTTPELTTSQESTIKTTQAPSENSMGLLTSETATSPSETEPSTTIPPTESLTTAVYIIIGICGLILLTLIIGVACILACCWDRSGKMGVEDTGPAISSPFHGDVAPDNLPGPMDLELEPQSGIRDETKHGGGMPALMDTGATEYDAAGITHGVENTVGGQPSQEYANLPNSRRERVESIISVSDGEDAEAAKNVPPVTMYKLQENGKEYAGGGEYANLPNSQRERVETSVSDEEDSDF